MRRDAFSYRRCAREYFMFVCWIVYNQRDETIPREAVFGVAGYENPCLGLIWLAEEMVS